jgi:hypothetical protein
MPLALTMVRTVVLPIVTVFMVSLFNEPSTSATTFAFLYVLIPAGPGTIVMAAHYGLPKDQMAGCTALSTALAMPFMFGGIAFLNLHSLKNIIPNIEKLFGGLSLFGASFILLSFPLFYRSQKYFPRRQITILAAAQFLFFAFSFGSNIQHLELGNYDYKTNKWLEPNAINSCDFFCLLGGFARSLMAPAIAVHLYIYASGRANILPLNRRSFVLYLPVWVTALLCTLIVFFSPKGHVHKVFVTLKVVLDIAGLVCLTALMYQMVRLYHVLAILRRRQKVTRWGDRTADKSNPGGGYLSMGTHMGKGDSGADMGLNMLVEALLQHERKLADGDSTKLQVGEVVQALRQAIAGTDSATDSAGSAGGADIPEAEPQCRTMQMSLEQARAAASVLSRGRALLAQLQRAEVEACHRARSDVLLTVDEGTDGVNREGEIGEDDHDGGEEMQHVSAGQRAVMVDRIERKHWGNKSGDIALGSTTRGTVRRNTGDPLTRPLLAAPPRERKLNPVLDNAFFCDPHEDERAADERVGDGDQTRGQQATALRECLIAAAAGAVESLDPNHPLEEETEENVMIFLTDDIYMRLLFVFMGYCTYSVISTSYHIYIVLMGLSLNGPLLIIRFLRIFLGYSTGLTTFLAFGLEPRLITLWIESVVAIVIRFKQVCGYKDDEGAADEEDEEGEEDEEDEENGDGIASEEGEADGIGWGSPGNINVTRDRSKSDSERDGMHQQSTFDLGAGSLEDTDFEADFLRRTNANRRGNASTVSGAAGSALQSELQKLLLQESRRQQLQSWMAVLRDQRAQEHQPLQQWKQRQAHRKKLVRAASSPANPTALSQRGGGTRSSMRASGLFDPSSNRTLSSVRELRLAQLWSDSQSHHLQSRPLSPRRQLDYDPLSVIGYFGSDQTPRERPRRRRRHPGN